MKGLTIVYTGNGKGKTTAAFGLALRAVGWGKRVLIIQFLKKQETGELKEIKKLRNLEIEGKKPFNNLTIEQFGSKDFVDPKHLRPVDYQEAVMALRTADQELRTKKWKMIILDEINVAVKFGLIKIDEVLELIEMARRKGIDLVLTGRWADKRIIEKADLVTEFVEIKHPFKKGRLAKAGIDY